MNILFTVVCICMSCVYNYAQAVDFLDYTSNLQETFDNLEGIDLDAKDYIFQSTTLLYPNRPVTYYMIGLIYTYAFEIQYKNKRSEVDFTNFSKAKSNLKKAMEIDSNYYLAIYALGQLYYQKAASRSKYFGVNDSKESYKKYALIVEKVENDLQKALYYFQKAEVINPNYIPILNALREIYTRQNNFEFAHVFEKRIIYIQEGGKLDTSFFDKN